MSRVIACLLVTVGSTWCAAQPRFARAGIAEGIAEIQIHPGEDWSRVILNAPLPQGARFRTALHGRFEAGLDDGSMLRLSGASLAELSDYTRLSTGQRLSLISLDRGTFYLTGRPAARDFLSVAVPGAQITLFRRARVRFEISASGTDIAILEGSARFTTRAAELELREGQMVHVDPAVQARFKLFREIPELDSDQWSAMLDAAQETSFAANPLPNFPFSTADLDRAGTWLHASDAGLVWKPRPIEGWTPFRLGTWRWYDGLGYTWIAAEPWGWLPYHFGRWLQHKSLGWVWVPGTGGTFKPGDVYWMRTAGLALWGPLTPSERWTGNGTPLQFAAANTTAAHFEAGSLGLDPSLPVTLPKDMVRNALFVAALPSPANLPNGLADENAPLVSAAYSFIPLTLAEPSTSRVLLEPPRVKEEFSPPPVSTTPPPPARSNTTVVDRPVYTEVPEPAEVYYPVPVYSGFIILNPVLAEARKSKRDSTAESPHRNRRRVPLSEDAAPPAP